MKIKFNMLLSHSNQIYYHPIDLHKLDEWKTIIKPDLAACEWMESDSESGSGSDSESMSDDDSDDDDSDDDSEMDTD